MPDPLELILKRLDELAARVERLEAEAKRPTPDADDAAPVVTPSAEPDAKPAASPPPRDLIADLVAPPTKRTPPTTPTPTPTPPPPKSPPTTKPATLADPLASFEKRPKTQKRPKPARSTTPLEFLIGGKGMAIVGGFVIVLAMGVLMKVGYDYGWWGRIPPAARCILAASFGLVLIGCGELALRRVGRMAAIGLFGAGLGTLYIAAFATTWRTMNVLSETGGFVAMAIVAFIGVAITIRGSLLSIGALSIIAAYVVPVLLQLESAYLVAPALYFTLLLAVALGLAALRPDPFGALRFIGIPVHALLVSGWAVQNGSSDPTVVLVFMTGWWGMMTAETILSATRSQSGQSSAVVSLLATAWFITLTCVALSGGPGMFWTDKRGMFTAAVGALSVVLAMQFGPGLEILRRRPTTAIEMLVVAFFVQAAALLIVAVALHFTSYGQAVAWLAIALMAIEAGRHIRSRGLDTFGLIALTLGVGRVVLIDSWMTFRGPPLQTWPLLLITAWSILLMGAILAIHAAAHRVRPSDEGLFWRRLPIVLTAIGVVGWLFWWGSQAREVATTGGWLIGATIMVATSRLGFRQRYGFFALLMTGLSAVRWLAIDTLQWRFEAGWSPLDTTPFANPSMAMASGIAIVGVWSATAFKAERRRVRGTVDEPSSIEPQVLAGVAFLWVAMSFQIEQIIAAMEPARGSDAVSTLWPSSLLRELWLTLFWALGAVVVFAVGAVMRLRVSLRAALTTVQVLVVLWLTWITNDLAYQWDEMPPVRLFANLHTITGACLGIIVFVMATSVSRIGLAELLSFDTSRNRGDTRPGYTPHWTLIGGVILWIGTIEIVRLFDSGLLELDNPEMARESTLSAFWGLYAIALIVIGFAKRLPVARYVGLTMLVVTLGKVLIRDMAEVEMLFRVASLLAIGILLVVTSIIYARLAPRLTGEPDAADKPPTYDEIP